MPLRLFQPPREGMYLLTIDGSEIPEQNKRSAPGPYRPACRGYARTLQRTIIYQNI